jgi:DNA polymerase (family 10)
VDTVKNRLVARILYEIADMLEMQDVQFKPAAYRRAARSVEGLSDPVEDVVAKGKVEELPGVGSSIAEKISEIVNTGSLKYYEELKKGSQVDLEALTSVQGIGPKTVQILYKRLGVKTLDDLERAAKEHKIREIKRLGPKTEQNILENVELARVKRVRALLGIAFPVAEDIRNRLIIATGTAGKVEIAGSLRRMKETTGDVDLLATSNEASHVADIFTTMPDVTKVLDKGESKCSVLLKDGMQIDLRIVDAKSFGSALMYFTGSKDHNVSMRKVAISQGYKLNEYGLFKGTRVIAGETEEEVFTKLGLNYISPELREDRGEIEAAKSWSLPKLIGYDAVKGDLQAHTKWSDGANTIEEMAEAAQALGYTYIAITDHYSPMKIVHGLNKEQLKEQAKEIEQVNSKIEGITVLKGAEVDIAPDGGLEGSKDVLKELDIVVASIHGRFKQSKQNMTHRIISAMESGVVDVIGHPTGRKINQKKPSEIDMETLFDASRRTGTYLEINAQPERLDLNDTDTKRALESGCKLAVDTDAHSIHELNFLRFGVAVARRGWCEQKDIINAQPLSTLLKTLEKK